MFNTDKPINSSKDDLLGRSEFALQLAEAILDISRQDSFVVGLYGKWGSGKTSVLNLTEEALKELSNKEGEPHITLIRFNPWGYTDGNQLVQQFFSALSNELETDSTDEKKKSVGEALEKYSFALDYLKLIPVVGQYLTFLPELASKIGSGMKENALSKENNVQYQKKKVSDALSQYEGKIVVFIDDIDRLPNDQIKMIFQLVNSVADFPNITYVLSFDREIVARALRDVQNCDGNEYLEKIIQFPISLPYISISELQNMLIAKIQEVLSDTTGGIFDQHHWTNVYRKCVIPFIRCLRDVYRFINVLEFKYTPLKNEINPVDFIGITALEVFATEVYDWIKINKEQLTNPQHGNDGYSKADRAANKKLWIDSFSELFRIAPGTALEAVSSLFPKFMNIIDLPDESISNQDLRRHYQIGHEDRFDAYFTLNIGNRYLAPSIVYASLRSMNDESLSEYLKLLLSQRLLKDYFMDIRDAINTISEHRAPLLATGFFSILGEIPEETPVFFTPETVELCQYLISHILRKISDEKQRIGLFIDLIENSDIQNVLACSYMLNAMELAQGRLAGSQVKPEEIVFSVENLECMETAFCDRLQKSLVAFKILDSTSFRMASYIWKSLDLEGYTTYMRSLLDSDANILLFIARTAITSISSETGINWSFRTAKDFENLLTVERANEAIKSAIRDKSFFDLPEELLVRVAAFPLYIENPPTQYEGITTKKALEWIREQCVMASVND